MSIFISEELDIIEVKFSFVVQIGRFWHFTTIYFKVEFTPTIYTQIKSPQVFRDFVCISYMRSMGSLTQTSQPFLCDFLGRYSKNWKTMNLLYYSFKYGSMEN